MAVINTVTKIEKVSFINAFYEFFGDTHRVDLNFVSSVLDEFVKYILEYTRENSDFNALLHISSYPIYLN